MPLFHTGFRLAVGYRRGATASARWFGAFGHRGFRFRAALALVLLPLCSLAGEPEGLRFVVPEASARAERLESYRLAIRELDFDFGQVGSVLEAIGYLELKERFPGPRYAVAASTQYFSADDQTLGELDLVVVDLTNSSVVAVYEAKLTGNPRSAGKHARSQLKRLQEKLRRDEIARFKARPGDPVLSHALFSKDTAMLLLGSREAEAFAWDAIVDITRSEGDLLQHALRSDTAIPRESSVP